MVTTYEDRNGSVLTPVKKVQYRKQGSGSGTPSSEASPAVKARLAELRSRAKASKDAQNNNLEADSSNGLKIGSDNGESSRPASRASASNISIPLASPNVGEIMVELSMSTIQETIKKAQLTGFLNISLRSLPKIPPEVYNQLIPRSSPYHPSNTATPQDAPMSLHDSVSFAMTPPEEVHPDGPKWWEVVDLTSIKASNNEFTQIDDCLGGFETLKVLDLRCNSIKAPLPASLCSLINLTSVNLARNKLAEWPIEIMALEHLKELDLSENDLSSLWPRDWTQKMSSRLKDSVRSRKYRMKTREDADVSCESSDSQNTTSDRDLSGEFWGTFPSSPIKSQGLACKSDTATFDEAIPLPYLNILKLRDNHIPASAFAVENLRRLPPSLLRVDLANNGLSGSLPLQLFSSLPQLQNLDLSNNGLGDDLFMSTSDTPLFTSPLFLAIKEIDLSQNAINSLGHLERCLGISEKLQVDYTGIASSSLRRVLANALPPDSQRANVTIKMAGNPLKEELSRRRTQTGKTDQSAEVVQDPVIPIDFNDTLTQNRVSSANEMVEAVISNMQLCMNGLKNFANTLSEDPASADSLMAKLVKVQALLLPVSDLLHGEHKGLLLSKGQEDTGQATYLAGAMDNKENEPPETSVAARRRKLKEAELAWGPL